MIGNIASLICAIITFGMALLQLSLIFGSPLGEYVLGGQHKVLPHRMRFISGAFTLLFTLFGMSYLQKGNILCIGLNARIVDIIIMISTLFLASAIIFNGFLTKSKKEKYVMTPFSIIQFVLNVIILFFSHK
jgi:hypothetical protein